MTPKDSVFGGGREERRIVKESSHQGATTLQDLVMAQALEIEALMNVLERKGFINKTAVLEEMKRLQTLAQKAK